MGKIVKMKARDLLNLSIDDLWNIPDGKMILTFDDGDLETTSRRTIFCVYLWRMHKVYVDLPLLKSHHMGMGRFSSKMQLKLMSTIYRDWFMFYNDQQDRSVCWKLMYDIVNDIYNDFTQRLDAYVSTMSALDFIEVLNDPQIHKANSSVMPTQKSIDETYDVIYKSLAENKSLDNNAIANAVRSSLVDIKQVNQCMGPRGYVTEIDSTIYKQPITVGYTQGMRSLYDSMIESRSAAKALMFAKTPLAVCEYFNRKLQLVAQVVTNIARGDCGSQHYMNWKVESSELSALEGINYLDGGEIKSIKASDHHLVGDVLSLRTPFGCIHPDRQTVCEVCYGQTAYSIPDGTVPGHIAAISIGEKTSQLVLSTKHVDGSSKVDDIDLGEIYSKYLIPGAEDNTLRLSRDLKDIPVKIIVASTDAKSLPDIYKINNFDDINVSRITEMVDVVFQIGDEKSEAGMEEITVPVSMGSRLGSLTDHMLYYIKEYGTTLDDKGDYVIDLANWDSGLALFELPLKHLNMLDYQDSVEKVILSTDKKNGLSKYEDPVEAIKALLALINSKLTINLSHIFVMSYAVSAVDPKNADYRTPRGGEDFKFVPITLLMDNRSLGGKMAHELQEVPLSKPETYTIKNRPRHPLDALLLG